jgi:microcystin-dependent protein
MSTPFLSEIKIVSFSFAPKGWALCNGQILAINQNQAIFSLIGTFYGGNGIQTFQLPNLQGAMALHMGNGGGGSYVIGQTGGEANVTLTSTQLPTHTHQAVGVSNAGNDSSAIGNTWAESQDQPYTFAPNVTMNNATLSSVGGSQPHSNMGPYLVLNFIIALSGIFPSRN